MSVNKWDFGEDCQSAFCYQPKREICWTAQIRKMMLQQKLSKKAIKTLSHLPLQVKTEITFIKRQVEYLGNIILIWKVAKAETVPSSLFSVITSLIPFLISPLLVTKSLPPEMRAEEARSRHRREESRQQADLLALGPSISSGIN